MGVALLWEDGFRATQGRREGRWRGRIDSRCKYLESDWSQFLLPPHQSVNPVNAKGEVGAEPKLPSTFTSFPVGAVQHVLGVEQNSRMKILRSSRPQWGGEEKSAPHAQARLEVRMSPEVVIHPGTECEHGLAHIVLVASGTFNGIDEVV